LTVYVLDASVAAKWFLPASGEPFASEAIRLLRDFETARIQLLVPDLFWPELGNVLWKAVRQSRVGRTMAETAIDRARAMEIATVPSGPLLKDAFAIATTSLRSFYDSLYLALAVASSTPLITADERLVNAVGSRFPVRWLGAI
jgi:predicted nucleic acid-binding protein